MSACKMKSNRLERVEKLQIKYENNFKGRASKSLHIFLKHLKQKYTAKAESLEISQAFLSNWLFKKNQQKL